MDDEDYGFFRRDPVETEEFDYREEQRKLREAGFTPYNCDYVDEFPRW